MNPLGQSAATDVEEVDEVKDVEKVADDSVVHLRPGEGRSQKQVGVFRLRAALVRSPSVAALAERASPLTTVAIRLAFQSIGVIYGDIGTSPLYVYSSTFSANPSYEDLVGVLSLIIWSLTLIVSVKYVLVVLRADDEGQGGTFALYSLLARYANIGMREPQDALTVRLERYQSVDMRAANKKLRSAMEHSTGAKTLLKIVAVIGAALVMADGVLTPAQSVLGAIQGLNVVKPDISTATVVGITCAILVLLFLLQPLGTSKIATTFAPIVVLWLLTNLGFGIYNLVVYDHSVLRAFSPYFAGHYLVRNKTEGWKSLSGVLLAFTGVEALFADLGAFSRLSIQLSWLAFAFPCLLLAYIGQAAYISRNPNAWANPFFNSAPRGWFYPSLVIAILASVVASQAMITSTFQLLAQAMKLSYFPRIKLVHTSKKFFGQIYIPMANWLLMIGTVVVTIVYHDTNKIGRAYGVCVILVTTITTFMVGLVALVVWRWHLVIVVAGVLVFGSLDGLYLSSALTKVPEGAWFTLMLASILASVALLWRYGKEQQWSAQDRHRLQPSQLLQPAEHGLVRLTPAYGGGELSSIRGMFIFFDKDGDKLPTVFAQFVRLFKVYPAHMIFFHMHPQQVPVVHPDERVMISRLRLPHAFRVTLRHGYTEPAVSEELRGLLYEQLRAFVRHDHVRGAAPAHAPVLTLEAELAALEAAFATQVIYVVGKEQARFRPRTNVVRKFFLAAFLLMKDLTRNKVAALQLPADQVVEIGFVEVL
ncbi:MAG: hypothetical protein M1826_005480 [Phylliscum demangeonii]|nr:MAG: hypothetical protein M1826_005480 [Phylliscum demangeonii]